jgi:uncharacterized protein (TIGR00369 family)
LPEFDHYDAELASRITDASLTATGLPAYLGIATTAAGPGTLTAGFPVREELLNPFGTMHGGALAALCDHVLGAVLYPVIERGAWAATTEFKLNLLAPVRQGEVEAMATIVSKTARTAVVRIEIVNDGRAVGLAQGTVLIQPPKQ